VYSDLYPSSAEPQNSSEHLVAIRADVLSDAEHALGNLFQRIYHLTRLTRDNLGPHAERLTGAVENVESLLELLFDYVSPVDVELRPVAAPKVFESLIAQVRPQTACELAPIECPAVYVVADSRLLRRSFQLMARAFAREFERASRVDLGVVSEDADRTEFSVRINVTDASPGAADAKLALAVAARLVDLNGGELHHAAAADALSWSIALPTSKEAHGAI
jgi:hypothetical protein